MKSEEAGENWPSAISGALWLGLSMALASGCACGIYGSFGTGLTTCLIVGGLVGFGTAACMLWLFHREQITVKDIWRGVGDLWTTFSKF